MATLVCTIELTKAGGITIIVEDKQANKTQKIELDGTKLVTTVSDAANTSTITQKPDGVSIQCKDFSVSADSITCESTQASKYSATTELSCSGEQQLTLKSSAQVGVQGAMVGVKANSMLTAESGGVAKLAGNLALIQASQVSIG